MTITEVNKALHQKEKHARRVSVVLGDDTLTGTPNAMYSVAYLAKEGAAYRQDMELLKEAGTACIQKHVDKATSRVYTTKLYALEGKDFYMRIGADYYIAKKYIDLIGHDGADFYRDPDVKQSALVAKNADGIVLAVIMPFSLTDTQAGLHE